MRRSLTFCLSPSQCIILFQFKACLSETVDATASSLTLDDSIDQSTSTVQNQETVIANSTGNLSADPTSYYVASPNELIDNETNSSPIVISNNVSTNRLLQQGKPNTTFENRIVETINDAPATGTDRNKQISMYTDQIGDLFNYAASSTSPDQFSGQPVSTSTLSSTTARSANNKNHYEFLNSNSLPLPPIREQAFGQATFNGNQPFNGSPQPFNGNQPSFNGNSPPFNNQQAFNQPGFNQAASYNQQGASFNQQSFGPNPASKLLPPIDDMIEFRLNGSTPFSKFISDKTTSSTNSPISSTTPNSPSSSPLSSQPNLMTPAPATMERSAGAMLAESAGDSMPELYNAPLSSFASTLQQVSQAKNKQSNSDKSLHLNTNIIPKSISDSPANQTGPSSEHPASPAPTGENRYRWVNNYTNRNKLPPYPPKQPNIPG